MGNIFTKENVYSAFRQKGGWRAFPESALSQLLSIQNNSYAKVAYFGMVYSDPLHKDNQIFEESYNMKSEE